MQGFIWGRYAWNHVMEILLELPKTSCYGKSCYGGIMLGTVLLYYILYFIYCLPMYPQINEHLSKILILTYINIFYIKMLGKYITIYNVVKKEYKKSGVNIQFYQWRTSKKCVLFVWLTTCNVYEFILTFMLLYSIDTYI